MSTTDSLDALLASTLADMASAEPREVAEANPFDCDVLDGDADHTLGMWRITYQTFMTDPGNDEE